MPSVLGGSGRKKAPHALEETLLARSVAARLGLERLLEPANELTLLRREVHGSLHRNTAEKVSPRAAAHGLYAFVPQPEHAAGLGLRRNLQRDIALERGHVHGPAERRSGKADRHLTAEVHAVALENRVLANLDLDVQVAGGSAVASGLALAREPHPVARIDSCRHLDRERTAAPDPPLSEAGIA